MAKMVFFQKKVSRSQRTCEVDLTDQLINTIRVVEIDEKNSLSALYSAH